MNDSTREQSQPGADPVRSSRNALGRPDRRAARDPRPRPDARARADRAAGGRDRRVARVPVGRRRAVPRARASSASSSTSATAAPAPATLLSLVAIEEVSKVCATSGLILAVQSLGSLGLKLAGSEEQKERYLPKLASGEWLAAYALTEAGSGSDSAAMRTRRGATATSTSSTARSASSRTPASPTLYTVFAKTDPDAGPRGISAFVVEADTPGFEVARLEPKMGISGSTTGRAHVRRLPHPGGEPARRRRRGLPDRDADPRPLASRRRGAGARDRAGRDRLRARVREDARDDGQADRPAPADRRPSSPTWRRSARRRAASSTASGRWPTRASTRRS